MKLIARQKIWLSIVLVTNVLLWIIPSDVVAEIARGRETLLGRYSRVHFHWNVGVGFLSLVSLYIDWATGDRYKRRWFQVIAAVVFLAPSLAAIDFLARTPDRLHYVRDSAAFHHPPNATYAQVYEDKAPTFRTFPGAPPGYGRVDCTLRTDRRGFRNQTSLESYDVVVLGDSFAEGSSVSDEHAWPRILAERSGLTVYNLGMSGYDPFQYLASLTEIGLSLKPRMVLCLLYEGNDFRSTKSDEKRQHPDFGDRFAEYMKQSPLLDVVDRSLIRTFGPIRAGAPLANSAVISWLPLTIPEGALGRRYAFEPKQLMDLYQTKDQFSLDKHWLNPRRQLGEMYEKCAGVGARLVVVYAPTKAHVTLPLAADRLPVDNVRRFAALGVKQELPEAATFLRNLRDRIEAKEEVVGEWSRQEGVAFVSLTPALREAVARGVQAYYTYDQHWTPDGHSVVADVMVDALRLTTESAFSDGR
ncbi:MAG: GDSL-type esterase/lipase family protein [Planctomycetota bacterium]